MSRSLAVSFAIVWFVLLRSAIYLAVGALCYALIHGGAFDWQAPMTYVWLLLWPLMLVFYFTMIALCAGAVALAVVGGWYLVAGR